ncbi:MAG: T9SS type A sorting domain-containing protein [candidate division Zixibacteria bacterium]|nr:T9SS type A sorting domain-containing protein [candidate division Zixibacteria bacterium]
MRKMLTIFTLVILGCSLTTAATPPGFTGQVVLDQKTVAAGDSFIMKLRLLNNNYDLSSLRIPLKFNSTDITCTYVDFTGSIKHPDMETYYAVNGSEIEIAFIPPVVNPLAMITADSGLIATLYFSVDPDAPASTVFIDTVYSDVQFEQFGKTFHRMNRLEATAETGFYSLLPDFVAGEVTVSNTTDIADDFAGTLPTSVMLSQNYPNPFNPATTISFALPERATVRLEIFNLLGQRVETVIDRMLDAGIHELTWDGSGQPSGVYFYRLNAASQCMTRKMILMK